MALIGFSNTFLSHYVLVTFLMRVFNSFYTLHLNFYVSEVHTFEFISCRINEFYYNFTADDANFFFSCIMRLFATLQNHHSDFTVELMADLINFVFDLRHKFTRIIIEVSSQDCLIFIYFLHNFSTSVYSEVECLLADFTNEWYAFWQLIDFYRRYTIIFSFANYVTIAFAFTDFFVTVNCFITVLFELLKEYSTRKRVENNENVRQFKSLFKRSFAGE